jgi:hypothetical protein
MTIIESRADCSADTPPIRLAGRFRHAEPIMLGLDRSPGRRAFTGAAGRSPGRAGGTGERIARRLPSPWAPP